MHACNSGSNTCRPQSLKRHIKNKHNAKDGENVSHVKDVTSPNSISSDNTTPDREHGWMDLSESGAGAAYTPDIEHVRHLIDRDEFYSFFSSECAKLISLPYENYHMETAFEKANKEWAMELMVLVADRILKMV